MRLLVCDNSQYVEFARCLGRSGLFASVGYFAPWQEDTPTAQEAAVGSGFPEIEREFDLFDALEQYDAFAFPALFWDGMQRWLRGQGLPVWGCGESEYLERNRWALISTMKKNGMKVANSQLVNLEAARDIVEDGDIIKISTWRGNSETVKHDGDWSWWFNLCSEWGPMRDRINVVVQKPIDGDCEPGFDFLVTNGDFLEPFGVGYEVKDGGYIEANLPIADMPEPLVRIYDGVRDLIKPDPTYTNFLSTEVLSGHLLDITTRMPQPPGDLKLYIWQGLPEVVYATLAGDPLPKMGTNPLHKWGIQIIAHNNNPKSYCRFGEIDESIADHIFFNRAINIDGEIWTVPWKDRSVQDWVDCAAVCASGDTPEEAIDEAQRIVDELKLPIGVLIDPSTKEHLMQALEKGYAEGIDL